MTQFFGIYVGNSSASIALFKDEEKVEILANDAGDRVTPAVIRISSSEQVVGTAAVTSISSRAQNTITCNKTLLDCNLPEDVMENVRKRSMVKIEVGDDKHIYYVINDEDKTLKYTPVQVATIILKKLFSIGQSAVPGQKELMCVICVPRHWGTDSRDLVLKAASDAGWRVLQLISEAPAATLAYRLDISTSTMNVLVYRLGGVSCEATIIEFEKGFLTVLSTVRSDNIGGRQLIDVLKNHLALEFKRKFHMEPEDSRKAMAKLGMAAESMFQALSTLTSCSKFIESVYEGVDFSVTLSRARLEALISPLLSQMTQPILEALNLAGLETCLINKVVLCGAPLKTPRLVSYVRGLFPEGVEVLQTLSPDEVLATGAARQASYFINYPLAAPITDPTLSLPVLSSPLYIQFNEDEEIVMEEEIVPCSRSISLPVSEPTLRVRARQVQDDNKVIVAEETMGEFSAPTILEIQVKLKANQQVVVEVLDAATNDIKSAVIKFFEEEE